MAFDTSMRPRTELDSPRDEASIRRTFEGYRAGLTRLTVPQLMALANQNAALLQEEARRLTFETLSASLERNLDQLVPRSEPTASPSPQPQDRPAPDSRSSQQPSPRDLRYRSERTGRRIVAGLARSGQASNARRARAEGRR
jgi:hypothetical protein